MGIPGPGGVLALIAGLVLWRINRSWFNGRYPNPTHRVHSSPSGLPAATVSVLETREVTGRTWLTIIAEMCQRGTLEVVSVRRAARTASNYTYRFEQRQPPEHEWERLILDTVADRAVTIENLHRALEAKSSDIGDSLGDYLRSRGLFNENPLRSKANYKADAPLVWVMLALAFMGTAIGLWLALWVSQWWVNAIVGGAVGAVYAYRTIPTRVGMIAPTEDGRHEIGQWIAYKAWLRKARADVISGPADSTLPYAIALDTAQPWLDGAVPAPEWFGTDAGPGGRAPDRDAAYQCFVSAPQWGLEGRSDNVAPAGRRHRGESVSETATSPPSGTAPPVIPEPLSAGQEASAAGDETPVYAPIQEQVFFDADRVFVSDYRLRFPYKTEAGHRVRFPIRTVEMFRIRSAMVDEARTAAETGLNKFLKVMGGIIKWPAFLGAMVIFIILLWNILFLVLNHYGIGGPGIPQGETPAYIEALAETFEAFPVRFSLVIGGIIVGLGVVAWMGDKIMRLRPVRATRYRVAVDVVDRRGESERLYFGECEGRDEAQRIVSAIEHAKVAIAARESGRG